MKKYNLISGFAAVISAMLFSACETNATRAVVYTDPIPELTVMTQVTTTPADTYSEYMATYTPTETSTQNYFAVPPPAMYGISSDTLMGTSSETAVTAAPVTDTAVTIPAAETAAASEVLSETSEAYDGKEGSESENSESSGMNIFSETPASFPELPVTDTASPNMVQADTAPPMHTETDAVSGTDTNISSE